MTGRFIRDGETPMKYIVGACRCKNISYTMGITKEPNFFSPRVCDCDFCRKHSAAYMSDKKGKLAIYVKDVSKLNKYRQENGIADFLICTQCGTLVGVCFDKDGRIYSAVNSQTVDSQIIFGQPITVSPRKLTNNEKMQRWLDIWFHDTEFIYVKSSNKSDNDPS